MNCKSTAKQNIQHSRELLSAIIERSTDLCQSLRHSKYPVVVYGMGNGADKIFDYLAAEGIEIDGVFASDDFVRGQSFRSHTVTTIAQLEKSYPLMNVLVGFGSGRAELIDRVRGICDRHRVFIPEFPVVGEGLFTKQCAMENLDELALAHSLLADAQSQLVFERLLELKISAEPALLWSLATPRVEALELLALTESEIFLDGGAYRGDSIDELLAVAGGKFCEITAFEPDRRAFRQLAKRYGSCENIRLINSALGGIDGEIRMLDNRGRGSRIAGQTPADKAGTPGKCMTIDALGLRPTLIKLDVEGGELSALMSAERTIRAHRPKLHIALYHRATDFFKLPLYISSCGEYRLYLRQHLHFPAWDLNLIAVP